MERDDARRPRGGAHASRDEERERGRDGMRRERRAAPNAEEHERTGGRGRGVERNGHAPATRVVGVARRQFAELTGLEPMQVSALERGDDGWTARIEVTELERIPPSTSVMGTYEVSLGPGGDVEGYRRLRRYYRNQADDEE